MFEAYLRGIETLKGKKSPSVIIMFEAYLRGIETSKEPQAGKAAGPSLKPT